MLTRLGHGIEQKFPAVRQHLWKTVSRWRLAP
jgi:hypothetical protein